MHRTSLNTKLVLIAAIPLLATAAAASEIYRYVDEDGTVHYVDRPTGEPEAERVAIVSRPTNNQAVQERYDARFGNSEADDEAAEDTEDENEPKTRAQRRAEAAERAKKCEQYRQQLEMVVSHRRLYREDENGERVYLSDDEVQESRDRAQELVDETCN